MTRSALTIALAAIFATLAIPASTRAQQPGAARPAAAARDGAAAGVGVAALRANWQQVTTNLTAAAEELSEAEYAYRPVPTVRSFGQLIGHVAGSQLMMCAAALGDPVPAEDAVEKAATTKAALVKALKESTAYCARAYAQADAAAATPTQLFDRTIPRFNALALNAVHNGEHYGNIVTYMRMQGKVPPSSRR